MKRPRQDRHPFVRARISFRSKAGLSDHDRSWVEKFGKAWPLRWRVVEVHNSAKGRLGNTGERLGLEDGDPEWYDGLLVYEAAETRVGVRKRFHEWVYDWEPDEADIMWGLIAMWAAQDALDQAGIVSDREAYLGGMETDDEEVPEGELRLIVAYRVRANGGQIIDKLKYIPVVEDLASSFPEGVRAGVHFTAVAFPIAEGRVRFDDRSLTDADTERYVYAWTPDADDLLWGAVLSYSVLKELRGRSYEPGLLRGLEDCPEEGVGGVVQ